ncbi:MAG: aspartate aminotransferase family protein [Desulfobacterales bacterium]|nr:aspartate aminotransferase family protein [Desulfobacterales bacterium]
MDTIALETKYAIPFFKKIPVSIEKGLGVYVWDEDGNKYIDFTSGWGVTCIGHANPVITDAIVNQSQKIIQNPCSGLTYSPIRSRLLSLLSEILPDGLNHVFFTNSGAESNDAAIKLARKVSGRTDIISTNMGFHGRTISTASATGQAKHRNKFNPLMPNYIFVPYDNIDEMESKMTDKVAAVILEPIQGEGGVIIPSADYLEKVSKLCVKFGSYLIIDEIQTGFCRTGKMFAIEDQNVKVDFMTMAKGIAGGFPFGALAVSSEVAAKIEKGDHGGTYCGNPLGCAVSHAVITHLIVNRIDKNVLHMGDIIIDRLNKQRAKYAEHISDVRGKGLLIALTLRENDLAEKVYLECIHNGLFVNLTQGNVIRIMPALNITKNEAEEGLRILEKSLQIAIAD